MRIAICPILASVIRTMMTMRAIASQAIIEKKVQGKQSGQFQANRAVQFQADRTAQS